MSPFWATARTEKVCSPGASGPVEKGESRITIDIPQLHDLPGLQKPAVGATHQIAARVLEQMKKAGVDVSGITALTVTFNKDNAFDKLPKQGETVSLTDPAHVK